MLISNLIVNYILLQPSDFIKRIEAARPSRNPEYSPIPDVRIKWQLAHMGVDELRKKVLDSERGEKDEKEWLINILLGKEAGLKAVEEEKQKNDGFVVKREGSS